MLGEGRRLGARVQGKDPLQLPLLAVYCETIQDRDKEKYKKYITEAQRDAMKETLEDRHQG